jgi:ATP-dependent protease HslVU (ClpYQ) peptidase subunit
MSTVVGLRTKRGLWIGSDSRASTEDGDVRPFVAPKIVENGPYLIGFIGSVRGGQIIQKHYFKAPTRVYDWPDALIAQCSEKLCITQAEGSSATMFCNYVVADSRDGKLYEILVDFQMNEIPEMSAIGSGSNFAFGSLWSTRELNINGEDRVQLALETAREFDAATGGPLIIKKLKRTKKSKSK